MKAVDCMHVGILDFGRNHAGAQPRVFYEDVLSCVKSAEERGFSRYWLAEHQSALDVWATTQLPIAWLAQQTRSIRLGSAGVLLDYHTPVEVASDFNLLEHLYPNRIDLGVARGKPHPPYAQLLQHGGDDFETRVATLADYFDDAAAPLARPLPLPPRRPEIWTLGTSDISMRLALRHGLNYAHSIFLPFTASFEGLKTFVAERASPRQLAVLAVAGVVAETTEAAQRITAEHDDAFSITPRIVGDLAACASFLEALVRESGADEIVFVDVARALDDRLTTIRLLSRLIG
jgi:luciferase family oxidoreductase group 1